MSEIRTACAFCISAAVTEESRASRAASAQPAACFCAFLDDAHCTVCHESVASGKQWECYATRIEQRSAVGLIIQRLLTLVLTLTVTVL